MADESGVVYDTQISQATALDLTDAQKTLIELKQQREEQLRQEIKTKQSELEHLRQQSLEGIKQDIQDKREKIQETGEKRADDIKKLLGDFYQKDVYKNTTIVRFIKNEKNNGLGQKSDIILLAKIDAKFHDFLLSLGWTVD